LKRRVSVSIALEDEECVCRDFFRDHNVDGGERRRMRILLVEDHSDSATVMARVLSHFGHQVDIAGTVTAAVDLFKNEQYDLVLCDLGLPDGSGIDLVHKLREIREVPAIRGTLSGLKQTSPLPRGSGRGRRFLCRIVPSGLRDIQVLELISQFVHL
jgi:CheY-like chemotaxis protein